MTNPPHLPQPYILKKEKKNCLVLCLIKWDPSSSDKLGKTLILNTGKYGNPVQNKNCRSLPFLKF